MRSRLLLPLAIFFLLCGLCIAGDQADSTSKQSSDSGTGEAAEQKTSNRPRVRLGGVVVTAGYTRYSGFPGWYGPYGYGPYAYALHPWYAWDPYFSPWIHPGFFSGFAYSPGFGQLKLRTADKSALVYIDDALAGSAGKLHDIWLEPGKYKIEVREGGRSFAQSVYMLSGKTLSVDARALRPTKDDRP
jgi:hypothetical protein